VKALRRFPGVSDDVAKLSPKFPLIGQSRSNGVSSPRLRERLERLLFCHISRKFYVVPEWKKIYSIRTSAEAFGPYSRKRPAGSVIFASLICHGSGRD